MRAAPAPALVYCVGHAVQDFVFAVPEIPTRAEKFRARRFVSVGGGPAATAAVAIVRLGGAAILAARLGADALADLISDELRSHGVDVRHLRRFPGCESSLSAVLVDQHGERLIVNYLDETLPDAAEWLPDPGELGAVAVLADLRWPEGARHAMLAARRSGIPAVLDADRPIPADPRILQAASHVAFSRDALCEYAGDQDPLRALRALELDAWTCVTLGAEGVLVLDRGRPHHVPAYDVPVIDTLGAGDVWHGAFALALAEGARELEAVRFASAAAAVKVQRAGGRAGAPRRDETEALLRATGA